MAFSRFVDLRGSVSSMYSDNGTTFKAAAHVLPELLEADKLQSFFRKKKISWEFIPPYSPSQGGAWESLIKVFKRTLIQVTKFPRTPTLVELQTYICNATRIVNDRPLTPLSDDPRDYTAISPSSLLTPLNDPHTPLGQPHNKDHLRRDYRYNISLAQQFWERWIRFYLPLLQKCKKWLTVADNLHVEQMVVVGVRVTSTKGEIIGLDVSQRSSHKCEGAKPWYVELRLQYRLVIVMVNPLLRILIVTFRKLRLWNWSNAM